MHPGTWHPAKCPKAGSSHHTFGYKGEPLGGRLGPWSHSAFLMCGDDGFVEGGRCGQRSRRNITILGLRPLSCHPEVLTFNLALPQAVSPTMNTHTLESQHLMRLEKAATLIPRPEASHSQISPKFHTQWILGNSFSLKELPNIHW